MISTPVVIVATRQGPRLLHSVILFLGVVVWYPNCLAERRRRYAMVRVSIPKNQTHCQNWIGADWCSGSGENIQIECPLTGAFLGHLQATTQEDLAACVAISSEAAQAWASVSIKDRCSVMFRAREILLRDCDAISHVVSSESGKTFDESKAGLLKGIEVLEYALSLQNLDSGGRMEVSTGVYCEYRREPLGVVAGITPFNFPAMVPMWMIPIALTLGNAFIWKPSEKTPLTSKLLTQVFHEAGLPAGVLNIVQGGRETVEAILDAPGIAAAAFVGSTAVARDVLRSRLFQPQAGACAWGRKESHYFDARR